eukprot:12380894-Prorocentrum_lima.AAC.1
MRYKRRRTRWRGRRWTMWSGRCSRRCATVMRGAGTSRSPSAAPRGPRPWMWGTRTQPTRR